MRVAGFNPQLRLGMVSIAGKKLECRPVTFPTPVEASQRDPRAAQSDNVTEAAQEYSLLAGAEQK